MPQARVPTIAASEPDDANLIGRVAGGDRSAFEQLYVRYHRRLSRFLMRFGRRYDDVEEIINDTMHLVWNKAGEFRGESRVSTWILGIAYHRAIKTFKRTDTRRDADAVSLDEALTIALSGEAAAAERSDWLAHGMAKLPLDQRMVIEMAYFLGHSCEEIAAIVRCPLNTVKTRMFHGRRRLRELLPQLAEPLAPEPRTPL